MRAATTQKYFNVARWDGVACQRINGSCAGSPGSCSVFFLAAYHHTIADIPASSMMMLTPVQRTVSPVARLPINSSCGQLWVYVTVSPGRFVEAHQADQKMKAERAVRRAGSGTEPAGMAYAVSPLSNTSPKCADTASKARARISSITMTLRFGS